MPVRGIRGAITVEDDRPDQILDASRALLQAILAANPGLAPEDMVSVVFTVTPDLTSAFPAQAARELGWREVPLLCAQEIANPNGLPRCIRVLLHWNTDRPQSAIQHVYLRRAVTLRPEFAITSGGLS